VDICVEVRVVVQAPTRRRVADNSRFLLRASGSRADALRAAEYV
jgi:hypothetical protein